jgi:hypothetical protein
MSGKDFMFERAESDETRCPALCFWMKGARCRRPAGHDDFHVGDGSDIPSRHVTNLFVWSDKHPLITAELESA